MVGAQRLQLQCRPGSKPWRNRTPARAVRAAQPLVVSKPMDFALLAHECAPWVAHQTMAAIVKTESAFRPLAIRVNGDARLTRQPETKAEAVVTAKWLMANGYSVDMGLGQ